MKLGWGLSVCLALLRKGVQAREGLHLATRGLIQIHPSFSGDGISLYPAHHPAHDPDDLEHLTPKLANELYYSQEGHRPALHGAKHGSFKANFTRPTVILDHTSHLASIKCIDHEIFLSFSNDIAYQHAQKTWTWPDFAIATYHLGCGDEYAGKRSFFHAQNLEWDAPSSSVTMQVTPMDQGDAIHSGEISWGTYVDPQQQKRSPVKGHIRMTPRRGADVTRRDDPDTPLRVNDTETGIYALPNGTDTIMPVSNARPVNLEKNATALMAFFEGEDFDTTDFDKPVPDDENPGFIDEDGTVKTKNTSSNATRRDVARKARKSGSLETGLTYHHLEDRGIIEFFKGLYNGIKQFFVSIGELLVRAANTVAGIAAVVVELAIIAAKLIAVPFGVPFDHSYHNDFKFTYVVAGEATNRPPKIFGYGDGFNLAASGAIYSVQCAHCGIHGDFSVDGRLAFSIQKGITDGRISLVNNDPFTINAIFGITVEAQVDKSVKSFEKQLAAVPLSPLTIPGIITLGPQISISGALDFTLNGKAELLLGGNLSIAEGTAALSLTKKADNRLEGFHTKFTPVAQFNGTITATAELGLPIAIEVGLDVLNGKFKKTVALVNKPSIYASAIATNKNGAKCKNGVELLIGVKNRIYVDALKLWNYDIRNDTLYERGLGCVRTTGFDKDAVEDDVSVFKPVTQTLGADISNNKPMINDVAANLTESHQNIGFRIIMDEDKTSILVSGQDGYVYLVGTDEKYDTSSPWGTIDLKSKGVDLDVFGRIMAANEADQFGTVRIIRLLDPAKVPSTSRAAALTIIKPPDQSTEVHAVLVVGSKATFNTEKDQVFYPTFCKTAKGLRLFGTQYVHDKDGKVVSNVKFATGIYPKIFKALGIADIKDCRTVRLTSSLT